MAYPVVIEDAERRAKLTLNGTVVRGDLLAHNATNWVRADASDADTNLYAQYVALNSGVSGDIIKGCKSCVLYDEDAPFTANATVYCSATAGGNTETRPTTAADVIQIVGRHISTKRTKIDIEHPKEVEDFLMWSFDTTGEAGIGVIDDPLWTGPGLNTNSTPEDVYFTGRFPSGVLSVLEAKVIYNGIGSVVGSISGAIVTCADGATNTGDTGTAHAAAAPTSAAADTLYYSDITDCFDDGALKADYNFTVAMTCSGLTAGDAQVLGLYMRYLCV